MHVFQLLYTSFIKMLNEVSWKSEKYFTTFFSNLFFIERKKQTMGKVGKFVCTHNVSSVESSHS